MRLRESIPSSYQNIVLDFLNAAPQVAEFFHTAPRKISDFAKFTGTYSLDPAIRSETSGLLAEYQKKLGGSQASIQNAQRLSQPNTFAIVSGQQPGFLSGPMFNLLKAATAVALARMLSKQGLPAIPVFWNHSEDHDLEETNHIYLPNSNYDLQKFRLPYSTEKKFLYDVVFDSRAVEVFDAAMSVLPQSEFLSDCADLFRPQIGNSLSQEFSRVLLRLFAQDGLVVAEPQILRRRANQALVKLLRLEPSFEETLAQSRNKLRALGYEPTIAKEQALLFEAFQGKRMRIEHRQGNWDLPSGKKLNSAQLALEIENDPLRFSPGALWRSLTQCQVLPVACYVGGPTELAYSAENFELFSRVGISAPRMLPRYSASFVEPSVQKSLEKLKLSVRDIWAPAASLARQFSNSEPALLGKLRAIRESSAAALRELEPELRAFDSSLLGPLSKTRDSVLNSIQKLEEKTLNAARNQFGAGERQIKKLRSLLYPQDQLQERVISPLYFFARHGLGMTQELLDLIDPFDFNHHVLEWGLDKENS